MNQAIIDYYRLPEVFANCYLGGNLSKQSGFFRIGPDAIGYGNVCGCVPSSGFGNNLPDVTGNMFTEKDSCFLPCDLGEVIDNFRFERYVDNFFKVKKNLKNTLLRNIYYAVRPILPVALRRHAQRQALSDWDKIPFPNWPVDHSVEVLLEKTLTLILRARGKLQIPFVWFWPKGYQSAVVMTHDIETQSGLDFSSRLVEIDASFGLRSSFEIIPENRYKVTEGFLKDIQSNGCEICIHGLNHDGHLFDEHSKFLRRAKRINEYAKKYGATGFRSPVLYRNLEWFEALEFSYDMSVPNVGHLDPQRGGCCTVMPYFIGNILELPLTTIQDYSLFHILNQYSITLWKQQVELILRKHGLISFIVHPDYIVSEKARYIYQCLLEYLSSIRSKRNVWFALPKEVDEWWRKRSQMKLVEVEGKWQIKGPGKERARVAYAKLEDDKIVYEIT